jgi:hypothetical protein
VKKKKSERKIDALTASARKALDSLWEETDLRGRCWGRKKETSQNPFSGTNITIAEDNEAVTINALPDLNGNPVLVIHEFRRARGTALGRKVRKILDEAELI